MSTESERYQTHLELGRLSFLGRETARAITLRTWRPEQIQQLSRIPFESPDKAQAFWDGLHDQLAADKRMRENHEIDQLFGDRGIHLEAAHAYRR